MVDVTIDGKQIAVESGVFILDAARHAGVAIPTLCHHEALAGLGSCRLCVVEVDEGAGPRVVAACVYPVRRNCTVHTQSKRIRNDRAVIISMLHDRAPNNAYILSLCAEYGVATKSAAPLPLERACTLCGRCVRACAELGTGAIATVGRGTSKKVSTPYDEPSADCVGCAACARVCPIGAIPVTDTANERVIWGKKFTLVTCERCGKPFATVEQLALAKSRLTIGADNAINLCPECRRRVTVVSG
jgi:NADH dehydrogenase/NADH:ubiquinone oxidoreductase subunit G